MPQLPRKRRSGEDPDYRYISWLGGLNTTQYKNKIKREEMSAAQNVEINVNSVDKRRGTADVDDTAKDSRSRGGAMYTHSDGTKKIIRASGDSIQEFNTTTDEWDDLTGKTYTSDLNTDFIQAYDNLYVFNGTDNLTKYNKDDSPVITTFTEVTAPTSPSAARGAGLSAGTFTAYYVLTHYNEIGETIATSEFSVTHDIKRIQWDAATEKVALSWTNAAGADGTNIYFSTTSGDWTYLDTVEGSTNSYDDFGGTLLPDGLTEPPDTNQTAGPIAYSGTFDGTRLWCFKASTLFYSGGGSRDIDHFDSGSGGGALNVAKGDGDEIKKVLATRDGTIIVYKEFSIWKAFFDSSGVINLKNVNQFVGCVGRRAATAVDDDQVFMSRFGLFTLGNQPNFPTDILRVKSISFPIEEELLRITPSNLPYVVLHYDFKRRLRLAFAEGGSTYNNAEFIFKYGAWTRNFNINANSYVNFTDVATGTPVLEELSKQHTLVFADDVGRVYQVDKGYSDRGAAIEAYFDTNQDNQGSPERFKKYYDQDVEIGRLQGTLVITQYFDSGDNIQATINNTATGGMGSEEVGASQVGLEIGDFQVNTSVSLTKRWRLFGRQQKNIRTRFYQSSATGTFSIMSFSGVYRLKGRRQYTSSDILDTTELAP